MLDKTKKEIASQVAWSKTTKMPTPVSDAQKIAKALKEDIKGLLKKKNNNNNKK